jgi:hypothetical protein
VHEAADESREVEEADEPHPQPIEIPPEDERERERVERWSKDIYRTNPTPCQLTKLNKEQKLTSCLKGGEEDEPQGGGRWPPCDGLGAGHELRQ